jgi:hypothetical protein
VSPNTLGLESTVTVTFEKKGEHTQMALVHSGLPDSDGGRGHEGGWNYFLGIFTKPRYTNNPWYKTSGRPGATRYLAGAF